LYFASGYFGGDRVPKRECAIVYHEDYFDDVAEHCDNTLTIKDIITMPYFDAMWCFPEKKTIRSVFFQGKGRAAPELDAIPIPAPQGCLHVSRQRTSTRQTFTRSWRMRQYCAGAGYGFQMGMVLSWQHSTRLTFPH
jgi:transketolase N-terminal domain/subunit